MCLDIGDDVDRARVLLAEFGFTAQMRGRGKEARVLTRETGFKRQRWNGEKGK